MSDCSVSIKLKNGDVVFYNGLDNIPISTFKNAYKEDLISLSTYASNLPNDCTKSNRFLQGAIDSAEYSPSSQEEIDKQKEIDKNTSQTSDKITIHNENSSSNNKPKNEEYSKNNSSNTIKSDNNATLGKYIKGLGGSSPLVSINDYYLSENELERLEIDTYDWIPKCQLVFTIHTGVFISRHFPKDGDLVSVFIRSFNDTFKPIRNDYLIDDIVTNYSLDNEASNITFYINGTLRVPNLYAEDCKVIEQKTSYEALLQLSTDLNLGFVSNEKNETTDKQNWLCTWETNADFIKYITKHSYKDEQSFYDIWIDYYYNLNFLDINKVISVHDKEPPKDGINKSSFSSDFVSDLDLFHSKSKIVLTNYRESAMSNSYFNKILLMNNTGKINTLNGYKRHIYFYDFNDKKVVDYFIDSLVTENSQKEKVVLKGRNNEDYYKTEIKSKWLGWQYRTPEHNVHTHYKEAFIHNFQNLNELKKINIQLSLPNSNFNLYKGQRIPIMFTIVEDSRGKVASNVEDDADNYGVVLDRFLSGYYMIIGIKFIYVYKPNLTTENITTKYTQEILVTRREWSMPNSPKRQTING